MDDATKNFYNRYDVKILNDTGRCLRRSRNIEYWTNPDDADYIENTGSTTETDKLITLSIPEFYLKRLIQIENKFFAGESNNDAVRTMFDTLIEKEFEEAVLRKNNEAVRKAYQNYSMLLHLVGFKKETIDNDS